MSSAVQAHPMADGDTGFRSPTRQRAFNRGQLIERGPQLPDDVIAARPGLVEEIIDRIRAAFEHAWPDLRAAMVEGEENEKFTEATLVPLPTDSDYDIVRSMYRTVGVEDFATFIGD